MDTNQSQFIIYQTEDGQTKLDVRFMDETVWLTQALMAQLFSTSPENVQMHLKNIYEEGELDQNPTTKDFLVVRLEGSRQVKRTLKHYKFRCNYFGGLSRAKPHSYPLSTVGYPAFTRIYC